jgi:aminodeoxychorismate synthase component I
LPKNLRHPRDFRPLDLTLRPAEVAAGLRGLPGLAFIDTSGNLPSSYPSAFSMIAASPEMTLRGSLRDSADLQQLRRALEERAVAKPDFGLPTGAAIGTIDYDGRFCFGFYDQLLVHAHQSKQWFQAGSLLEHLHSSPSKPHSPLNGWEPNFTRAEFLAAIAKAQEYIAAGDIYQVNLAQRFQTTLAGETDLFDLYDRLRQLSPAPMAAYLDTSDREVLSSSPETFLRMHGRSIETRPIKGTRPRFNDPETDSRSAFELQTSEKEIAELVMITDLERNDLGQVCEFGSVKVTEMLKLERLEQVYHLISTVSGQLRPEVSHLEALTACFPGGSITGAPKQRATEIIAELEPDPRGLYTGAIGYFGYNGESQFNIAIRTLVRDKINQTLSYHVGAGIVADSHPESEYEETLQKAEGIRLALESVRTV